MKLALVAAALAACSSAAPPPPVAPPAAKPAAFKPTAFSVKVSGAGRPVIFIPGLASPGEVWDGTVAHLGGKVQAHVLTLAGFAGQPPMPVGEPFMQRVHDQIVQYIDANNLERPIIIGHSLGGVMSLWLAETDPVISGVVDIDGLPFLPAVMDPTTTSDKAMQMAAGMRQQMLAAPHDQFVGFMHQFLGGAVADPAQVKMLDDAAEKSNQPTVANAFAELMAKDLRPDLPKINAPVIVIAAGESQLPKDQLEHGWKIQVDPIPNHQLIIVDGAKHFVMLDKPDEVYQQVDKVLVMSAAP